MDDELELIDGLITGVSEVTIPPIPDPEAEPDPDAPPPPDVPAVRVTTSSGSFDIFKSDLLTPSDITLVYEKDTVNPVQLINGHDALLVMIVGVGKLGKYKVTPVEDIRDENSDEWIDYWVDSTFGFDNLSFSGVLGGYIDAKDTSAFTTTGITRFDGSKFAITSSGVYYIPFIASAIASASPVLKIKKVGNYAVCKRGIVRSSSGYAPYGLAYVKEAETLITETPDGNVNGLEMYHSPKKVVPRVLVNYYLNESNNLTYCLDYDSSDNVVGDFLMPFTTECGFTASANKLTINNNFTGSTVTTELPLVNGELATESKLTSLEVHHVCFNATRFPMNVPDGYVDGGEGIVNIMPGDVALRHGTLCMLDFQVKIVMSAVLGGLSNRLTFGEVVSKLNEINS